MGILGAWIDAKKSVEDAAQALQDRVDAKNLLIQQKQERDADAALNYVSSLENNVDWALRATPDEKAGVLAAKQKALKMRGFPGVDSLADPIPDAYQQAMYEAMKNARAGVDPEVSADAIMRRFGVNGWLDGQAVDLQNQYTAGTAATSTPSPTLAPTTPEGRIAGGPAPGSLDPQNPSAVVQPGPVITPAIPPRPLTKREALIAMITPHWEPPLTRAEKEDKYYKDIDRLQKDQADNLDIPGAAFAPRWQAINADGAKIGKPEIDIKTAVTMGRQLDYLTRAKIEAAAGIAQLKTAADIAKFNATLTSKEGIAGLKHEEWKADHALDVKKAAGDAEVDAASIAYKNAQTNDLINNPPVRGGAALKPRKRPLFMDISADKANELVELGVSSNVPGVHALKVIGKMVADGLLTNTTSGYKREFKGEAQRDKNGILVKVKDADGKMQPVYPSQEGAIRKRIDALNKQYDDKAAAAGGAVDTSDQGKLTDTHGRTFKANGCVDYVKAQLSYAGQPATDLRKLPLVGRGNKTQAGVGDVVMLSPSGGSKSNHWARVSADGVHVDEFITDKGVAKGISHTRTVDQLRSRIVAVYRPGDGTGSPTVGKPSPASSGAFKADPQVVGIVDALAGNKAKTATQATAALRSAGANEAEVDYYMNTHFWGKHGRPAPHSQE